VDTLAQKICVTRVGTPAERAAKERAELVDLKWSETVEEVVEHYKREHGGTE
jgi:hypothetical protein